MESKNSENKVSRLFSKTSSSKIAHHKTFKIALVYFLLGSSWIIFSDKFIEFLFIEQAELIQASLIKGIAYVVITTIVIYLLIYYAFKNVIESETIVRSKNDELQKTTDKYKDLYLLHQNKQLLTKSLIDSIEDWIFYVDKECNFLGCNKAFEVFFDVNEDELINQPNAILKNPTLYDICLHNKELQDMLFVKFERTLKDRLNNDTVFEIISSPYYDLDNKIYGTICVGRDITERKQQEDKVTYLSYHDVLTGLYNRAYFEQYRNKIDIEENLPISVIVCDVDGLKLVNDAFGHASGDKLLKMTATILATFCRSQDMLVRTGGDEFTIILPKTSYHEAEFIHEGINKKCIEEQQHVDNDLLFPSISMGYATKTNMNEKLESIFNEAEEYMYRRKLLARKGVHSVFLKYIMTTIYEKSNETQEHCQRMVDMAKHLGSLINVPHRELDTLELATSLHDVGKISVDLSILQKDSSLTDDEWDVLRRHPETGWRIAQAVPDLYHIAEIILYHHERWDGQGYPRGLKQTEIPLLSRIITVVDSFDAMTSDRPYHKALSIDQAIIEMKDNAGSQFDPYLVDIFIKDVLPSYQY